METVKARKQGNSIALTVPKVFDVTLGTEYTVFQQPDGRILKSDTKIAKNFLNAKQIKQL